MRILDNPKLTVAHIAPGLRRIVLEASTGELIACEVDDATATAWSLVINASPSESPSSTGEVAS